MGDAGLLGASGQRTGQQFGTHNPELVLWNDGLSSA